jgi:hypothetical protein
MMLSGRLFSAVVLLLASLLAPLAAAQDRIEVIFDEEANLGATFRDASWGISSGNAFVRRAGPGSDKIPIVSGNAYSGTHAAMLEYRNAATGSWEMFVAGDGWRVINTSDLDTLAFQLRLPAAIPPAALPRIGVEDLSNRRSNQIDLAAYIDPGQVSHWIRVAIPLNAFSGIDRARLKAVFFTAGAADPGLHRIDLDFIRAFRADPTAPPPSPPSNLTARVGDRSVILRWEAGEDPPPFGYRVFRAYPGQAPEAIGPALLQRPVFVDLEVDNGLAEYTVVALTAAGRESLPAEAVQVAPSVLTDEAFVDLIQRTAFDYMWYEANAANGLIRDRSTPQSPSSVAAVGFGLSSLCIGVERGWVSREAGVERVLTTLRTFWEKPQGPASSGTIGHRGFFYHFLDMNTATRSPGSELSSIDTALLLAGVIHARHFFDGEGDEATIRALADSIYNRVDWQWMTNNDISLTHGWFPESGFISHRWIGYDEGMILYLLAMGSPTFPLPASSWREWTRNYRWETHYGHSFVVFPPLFGHQYSHAWVDFRGIADAYMRERGIDYFENSRRATLASRAYAIANPGGFAGYGGNIWGITASDGPNGYLARGAPPAMNDNGTIAPTAAGGSIAFTPAESIAALRAMYDLLRPRLWGEYGFRDAFNLQLDWYASDFLGIDQGIILLMAENHRSEHVWRYVMRDERVHLGLAKAGFEHVVSIDAPVAGGAFILEGVFPHPVRDRAEIRYAVDRPGEVRLAAYDVLGRRVAVLVQGHHMAGSQRHEIDASGLASGLYHLVLDTPSGRLSRPLIIAR